MKYRVKITRLPQARTGYQVQGALANDISDFSGNASGSYLGKPNQEVRKSMGRVPRDEANLEAEGGETLVGDIDGSTFPSFFNIKGPRHSSGGVPMSLPDDTFIFSDTKAMKIIDPKILKMFGKSPKKGGYTPAELSKVYDINKYRKLLQDPDSNKVELKTAEMMIKNYVIKLGALAIAQESKKGFPQGIPVIAKPYMEANNIKEEDLIPENARQQQNEMSQEEEEPTEMPSEQPIAMPQEQQSMQEPPMNQEDTMRFGGMRRLRRAQEGMQQPSPEQMAMMQQQQQGQQQEQGGDQMEELIQQVTQAIEQGAKPEEVVAELLQEKISAEEIAQIFVELGMPENEVEQLIMGVIQQMQGAQQQQMDPRQQQQQPISEEEMMAMQQQDPQQMQQSPMAKYGMLMGGFGMPLILENGGSSFYGMQNPMNYGSSKLNMFTGNDLYTAKNGVELNKFEGEGNSQVNTDGTPKTKAQLEKELRDGKVTVVKTKKLPDGTVEITRSDGSKVYAKGNASGDIIYQKDPEKGKKGTGTVDPAAYKKGLCDRIRKEGYTAEQAAGAGWIHSSQIANFKNCENLKRTGEDKSEFYELEQDCPCKDDKGVEIPGVFATKDDAGNCLPETCFKESKKCYCEDETGKEVETKLTNGECLCEYEDEMQSNDAYGQTTPWQIPMAWTPQDERNLAAAMRTRTGIEYPTAMTYQYPEVELAKEEWLAKVQGLQGQAAKNIDSLEGTAGSSAAKRSLKASLDGDTAEGIVGAIASTQARNIGTENQERMLNYQGDIAEGTNRQNILNLNADKTGATENNYRGELNTKDALKTQMMNIGDKNAADIYNLQTEQAGIDPRSGKLIFKGGKPLVPEDPGMSEIAYAQSLKEAGLEDDEREILLKARYSRFGGPILRIGGMVYGDTVYPFQYYK